MSAESCGCLKPETSMACGGTGCLKVNASRAVDGIGCVASRAVGGIECVASRAVGGIGCVASRAVGGLIADASVVCSVTTRRRLSVEPEYIFLFAADGNQADVDVISNTRWDVL